MSASLDAVLGGTHGARTGLAARLSGRAALAANLANPQVTTGAIDPNQECTRISTTGTQAFTLANGTYVGQEVNLIQRVAASTPNPTITPATAVNFTSFNLGTAVGNSAKLVWNGTGWILALLTGTGVSIT